MTTLRAIATAALVAGTFSLALAKLPPPQLTDAQKTAAEEKKAKDAAAAEVEKQALAKAEDRTAARYFAEMKAKGKQASPPQTAATGGAPPPAKGAPAAKK